MKVIAGKQPLVLQVHYQTPTQATCTARQNFLEISTEKSCLFAQNFCDISREQ